MREHRLGDVIDDYCVKCKQIMNHAIVSLVNAEPAKVRCRTCHNDHDFRHEIAPPTKAELKKQALFNEVLSHVDPSAGDPLELEPDPEPEPEPEPEPAPDPKPPKAAKTTKFKKKS